MTIWLLDLNGVLTHKVGGADVRTIRARSLRGKEYVIPFLPSIIEQVAELSTVVDIRWCSTWGANAVEVGVRMGLPEFPVVPAKRAGEAKSWQNSRWWKIARYTEAGREAPVIWTDDKLAMIKTPTLDRGLAVGTDADLGLTDRNLATIREWIA